MFNKQKPIFEDDKSIYNCYEIVLETKREDKDYINHVIVARRMYMPPEGEKYQDFVFEYSQAKVSEKTKDDVRQDLHQIVQSLNPLARCFLYDTLLIRSRLETLGGDDDFYTWAGKRMHMKPELTPNSESDSDLEQQPQANLFAKSILDILEPKEFTQEQLEAPFVMEALIRENVEALPNERRDHVWRTRLASYLAYYTDAGELGLGYSDKLSLKQMIDTITTTQNESVKAVLKELINYFLHLKPLEGAYDSTKPLIERIESLDAIATQKQEALLEEMKAYDINDEMDDDMDDLDEDWDAKEKDRLREDTAVKTGNRVLYQQIVSKGINAEPCFMNTQVFLKLLRLDYFDKINLRLSGFVFFINSYILGLYNFYHLESALPNNLKYCMVFA